MQFHKIFTLFASVFFALGLAACSGGSDGDDTDTNLNLTIEGDVVEGDSTDYEGSLSGTLKPGTGSANVSSKALGDLRFYCVTFAEPPGAGTGDLNGEGFFELTIEGGKDTAFGCFIREGNSTVATLVFEDSEQDGFGGESARQGTVSLSKDTDLGAIVLDLDRGIAVADIANFRDAQTGGGGNFDFSGNWTMTNADTIPTGYVAMPEPEDCGPDGCDGPHNGMQIYINRLVGHRFVPDSNCINDLINGSLTECDGSTTDESVYGIMVWQSETAADNCGNKLGFTKLEANAHAQIDLDLNASGGGVAYGPHDWNVDGHPDNLTFVDNDPWRFAQATADRDYYEGGSPTPAIDQDALCSSGGTDLLQYQCWAEFYNNAETDKNENYCQPNIRTNWDAGDIDGFLDGGDLKPGTLFVLEKFQYSNPNTGTFSQPEYYTDSFYDQDSDTNIYCEISHTVTMTIKRISDNRMLGDFQIVEGTTTDNEVCHEKVSDPVALLVHFTR